MSRTQVNAEFASSHGGSVPSQRKPLDSELGSSRSKKTYEYRGPRCLAAGQLPLLSR
jgi:hypothetical protein